MYETKEYLAIHALKCMLTTADFKWLNNLNDEHQKYIEQSPSVKAT